MAKRERNSPSDAGMSFTEDQEVLFTSKRAKWAWIQAHDMAEIVLKVSELFGKPDTVTCYLRPPDLSKSSEKKDGSPG
jgi:hypothetical protein